jgi:hypothetical protein
LGGYGVGKFGKLGRSGNLGGLEGLEVQKDRQDPLAGSECIFATSCTMCKLSFRSLPQRKTCPQQVPGPGSLLFDGYLLCGKLAWAKLITHIHLVTRLRICAAVLSFHHTLS